MTQKAFRHWIPPTSKAYIESLEQNYAKLSTDELEYEVDKLIVENRDIHEHQCINLNPATNVMNPKAEAVLAAGLGSRPSLGYPGDKYEMGLEAIEKIEVLATKLACEIFGSDYAEIRLASGAMANLYAFMATTKPGDKIIVPPPEIGGHVTHHQAGAAGLYGLDIHYAPVDADNYTVDVNALYEMAKKLRPKLITIGGSLNLCYHPVRKIRDIADELGCYVHFDAAHLCGVIAGQGWPNPLKEGAHLMTFSTYKSLGGPPAGIIVTNDDELARRIDKIAFPGLTANFDVAKSASLAIALLDWKIYGKDYAQAMIKTAQALATQLIKKNIPVFLANQKNTVSHQFAINAQQYGGGQKMAKLLRRANLLTCGIGLPIPAVENDMNGLRIGTPEIVRWGMQEKDMPEVASLIAAVLSGNKSPEVIAKDVTRFKEKFSTLAFIRK